MKEESVFLLFLFSVFFNPPYVCEGGFDSSLWFETDELIAQGIDSYNISEGLYLPSEVVWFRFPTEETVEVNWTLIVKLIRVDVEPLTVYEKNMTIVKVRPPGLQYPVRLPDDVPAKYRFGVIKSDHVKGTKGTLISTIEVKEFSQLIDAVITIDKEEYHYCEDIIFTIRNIGRFPIEMSHSYRIDKWKDGEWMKVSPAVKAVPVDIGYTLKLGKKYSHTIDVSERYNCLTEGRYRVNKRDLNLTAEFRVIRSDEPELVKIQREVHLKRILKPVYKVLFFLIPAAIIGILFIHRRRSPVKPRARPW